MPVTWFGCRVIVVSKVDSKNVCPKGMISRKKVPAATRIRTNDFLFGSQVLYHLNTVCCAFKGMLLKFSLHLCVQLTLQSEQKHT